MTNWLTFTVHADSTCVIDKRVAPLLSIGSDELCSLKQRQRHNSNEGRVIRRIL